MKSYVLGVYAMTSSNHVHVCMRHLEEHEAVAGRRELGHGVVVQVVVQIAVPLQEALREGDDISEAQIMLWDAETSAGK